MIPVERDVERDIRLLEAKAAQTRERLDAERDPVRAEQLRFVLRAIELQLAELRGETPLGADA